MRPSRRSSNPSREHCALAGAACASTCMSCECEQTCTRLVPITLRVSVSSIPGVDMLRPADDRYRDRPSAWLRHSEASRRKGVRGPSAVWLVQTSHRRNILVFMANVSLQPGCMPAPTGTGSSGTFISVITQTFKLSWLICYYDYYITMTIISALLRPSRPWLKSTRTRHCSAGTNTSHCHPSSR